MPTYEYACRDCGRHLEVVQRFTEKPLTKCPSCSGSLRKVWSPVGIILKGSGFYRTDSRPAGKPSEKKTAEASTSESKSDAKSDTKVEKKSEKKSTAAGEKSA